MPEGERNDDDDDEVNGEDEERNVDIEQSGEDQLGKSAQSFIRIDLTLRRRRYHQHYRSRNEPQPY